MDTSLTIKRIAIFLGFAFGIPWVVALILALSGVWENNPLQAVTLANLVFISTPVVANLATRLTTKEGWGNFMLRPHFRRGWRFWLATWLLPFLAAVIGGALFYLLFPQSFDPTLDGLRKLTASTPALAEINPWLFMLSITMQIVLIATPINAVVSLGEELGWRAYLLPKLMAHFAEAGPANASAARRAAVLVGLIHGVWHWPLFFLSTKLDSGSAFPFPLVYLVFTCSMSILLSWATLRSGSVWPATIGHGAINGTAALAGYLLKGPALPLLGPAPTGLISGLAYLVLALGLLFSRRAFAQDEIADQTSLLTKNTSEG
ncbi:MAG: CPBP family intramembrane glutamic endopeptidase [Chloroflexota bacterium]